LSKISINKWGWLNNTVPIFILSSLAVIFFSDVLFQGKIFIHRDLSRFFYPLREFSAAQFLSGKIPLWDPYIQCGNPHLAELQTCVFYPLSLIYLLFPYPQAFNYFIVVHIILAGLFTYILMRDWDYSTHASFFSAAVFMFSGYIISVINLLASLVSVIWLPLVILFYERSLKENWLKNSIITGAFMTMMFLGGEPVILYSTFFILILFNRIGVAERLVLSGVPSLSRDKAEGSSARNCLERSSLVLASLLQNARGYRSIILAFMIFLGLASFQIVPFLEFVRQSSRNLMDFNEASMWSLPVYALSELFFPYLSESDYIYKDYWTRQSWLLVYYMGIAAIIFAFISLKFDSTRRRKAVFLILAGGALLSFGRYTPLYYFLYNFLPGFKFSRYPIKFFFMAAFSLAVLAGMGMDYYAVRAKEDPAFQRFLKWLMGIGASLSFIYLLLNLNFSEVCDFLKQMALNAGGDFSVKADRIGPLVTTGLHNIKRGIGFFMVLSVIMFFGTKKRMGLKLALVFILLLAITDIFTANKNVYQNIGIKEFVRPGATIEFLQKDKSLFRIFDSPATLSQNMFVPEKGYLESNLALIERVVSNRGVSFGIYDAYGYGSLYNKRHEEVMDIIVRSKTPDETSLLNLLNVKYVISPKNLKINGYKMAKKTEKVNIYENKGFLPRAFLAGKAVVIKNEKAILERLKSRDFKPEKEVILEDDYQLSAVSFQLSAVSFQEGVSILKYDPGEVIIEAKIDAPRFLVLSDTWYPGWKAYVDGKLDKIYRADYILRAVYLQKGKHIVRFTYDPFSFKIGCIITFATIGILLGLWIKKL